MAKYGIMTFHSAINYGAALQAFALQKKMCEIGYDCKIIDYRNVFFERFYQAHKNYNIHNVIKRNLIYVVKYIAYSKKKARYKKFLINSVSHKRYSSSNINDSLSDFDYFIAGSDQVWNLTISGGDKRYFLDFVPSQRKKSYAVSFGFVDFPCEKKDEYITLLQDFCCYSMREETGVNLIRKYFPEKKVAKHLDPTLLLTGRDWAKLCYNVKKGKYILYYEVAEQKNLYKFVKDFADRNGYDVVEISSELRKVRPCFYSNHTSGPIEFISFIKNADYVATTSFHAVVFALLFHKNFFVETEDNTGKVNVRVNDLLSLSGIKIESDNNIVRVIDPEWERVDQNIDIERKISCEYLTCF